MPDATDRRDPVVTIVHHPDVTVKDLKAYRGKHGCSLKEAVDALGWKGNRLIRASKIEK